MTTQKDRICPPRRDFQHANFFWLRALAPGARLPAFPTPRVTTRSGFNQKKAENPRRDSGNLGASVAESEEAKSKARLLLAMAPSSRDRGETEGLLFEEAIEKIGMGFFQYKLLFVCGLGWIADTMEMVVFAYCLPYLTSEWPHITNFHKGVLVATAYFGMAVGAVCWSYLSDSIGRRATFVASLLFVIVFGVLSGVLQMHSRKCQFLIMLCFCSCSVCNFRPLVWHIPLLARFWSRRQSSRGFHHLL